MNYYGGRHHERYTYRRVDWQTYSELTDYGNITSGSVELSALSDTKATCSFNYEGTETIDTNDLVRIYYTFTDDDGNTEKYAVGTFIVSYAEQTTVVTQQGNKVSGSCDGYSLLKKPLETKVGYPLTIAASTNAVDQVKLYCARFNIRTNNTTSTYTTSAAHTFEATDSYLTVINWLLTSAGYSSLGIDAYGVAQITPYVEPTSRAVRETFAPGSNSIMQASVSVENDYQETANDYWLNYEDDTMGLWAHAYVQDGAKFAYNQNGHRLISADPESISELTETTAANRLTELKAKVVSACKDGCSEIEHVTLTHAYLPYLAPNDSVRVEYGGTWSGNITNMSVGLSAGTQCTTKFRKFIDNDLTISVDGGISWQA